MQSFRRSTVSWYVGISGCLGFFTWPAEGIREILLFFVLAGQSRNQEKLHCEEVASQRRVYSRKRYVMNEYISK